MERKLYTKLEVIEFIRAGKQLVLSGDEDLLDQLPKGNWIGGTSPYFMDNNGGVFSTGKIFVDDFTNIASGFKIESYDKNSIKKIAAESFHNGFIVLIIPGDSETLFEFGINSLSYDKIFDNPVVGFVAGFDMAKMGKSSPKVYNGLTGEKLDKNGIAIHIQLPEGKVARAEILNLDTIDINSPRIRFPITSFTQSECTVNGDKTNIAEFLTHIKYKEGLPLISNYNGALINRDIKKIDIEKKEVVFFSPVFNDETYNLANVIDNYFQLFNEKLDNQGKDVVYCSLCVSYYFLGKLENKKINAEGVFAFGEIAYQLLNQTLVFLSLDE